MQFASEMDPFQAEVSRDQSLMTRRKPEYGAIVSNTRQDAIPCARLTANAGDQGFFQKRQSEANIDDKTIPPKPTYARRLQSNPASNQFVYPSPHARLHVRSHMTAVAASMARIGLIAQFPEVTDGNCPQGLFGVTRPW
jgi:hypothetical protein